MKIKIEREIHMKEKKVIDLYVKYLDVKEKYEKERTEE